jgi:uncharacterized protein
MSLGSIAGFFVTALLYASVGFAGGSTYTAMLLLAGVGQKTLPIISLLCNLIVSTGGSVRFARAGLVPWRRLIPLLGVSVPAAMIGGALPVSKTLFVILLGGSLIVAGILLLVQPEPRLHGDESRRFALVGPVIAGPLGLLAGIVGIGGGIFLAPVLHLIGWDQAKRVAASASVFILANSIAGLIGQLVKSGSNQATWTEVLAYWPLAIAVLIGGQIGSRVGVQIISPALLRRLTAVLIIFAALYLLWKTFFS